MGLACTHSIVSNVSVIQATFNRALTGQSSRIIHSFVGCADPDVVLMFVLLLSRRAKVGFFLKTFQIAVWDIRMNKSAIPNCRFFANTIGQRSRTSCSFERGNGDLVCLAGSYLVFAFRVRRSARVFLRNSGSSSFTAATMDHQ